MVVESNDDCVVTDDDVIGIVFVVELTKVIVVAASVVTSMVADGTVASVVDVSLTGSWLKSVDWAIDMVEIVEGSES